MRAVGGVCGLWEGFVGCEGFVGVGGACGGRERLGLTVALFRGAQL